MKLVATILFHLLGVACIAADVAIIATLGQQDLSWAGWIAIAFYWIFAVRLAMGWKRLTGRPLRLILVGFYVMGSLMLLGIGFAQKMGAPSMLLAFAPLAVGLIGRVIIDLVQARKRPKAKPVTPPPPTKATTHDQLFGS
jgi:hypothetical protein